MPHAAAFNSSSQDACRQIAALLASAMQFVPRDRGEAIVRKWLARRDIEEMSEDRLVAMAADATLLSADLLLSQPAASGTTALDRLAKSRANAPPAEAAAIAALRKAQFRLLRLERGAPMRELLVRDVVSDEEFHLVGAELPPLAAGTVLFGRVVMLDGGLCCLPGAITPLDLAALAVARGHPAAAAPSVSAGVRWAEAVYGHVVRHGTLDVPGLNRPAGDVDSQDDLFETEGGPLLTLAIAWAALVDETPDASLLQRTRHLANLPTMLNALAAAVSAGDSRNEDMALAFERLLLVQMETVLRRERAGSGTLTLGAVGSAVDSAIATGRLPPTARTLFRSLQQRLAGDGGVRRADDPALERLVQRIQGLRAKTVAQGCTEQEALAAAEKVAELLDRYGLSLGELDFRAQPCDGIGIQTNRRRFAPIDSCVPGVAAFFDCRVWVEQATGMALRYVFFGLRGDVAAAQYLYEMVERAFEIETDAFRASALYARMAGERRSATNSFQIGLGRGISHKLQAMRTERFASRRSATGRDLVPIKAAMVDEEVAKLGLDLRTREMGRRRRVLADALTAGEAAGHRFEFTPAISQAA
ncbi:MAG TPA: DUF2786 domain-containing protein [Acetobacteraceae bacterium]|jgi:hypothetical protein|nr:DUF2786 domain-containing protein [Acetobacteraceae bacterium]